LQSDFKGRCIFSASVVYNGTFYVTKPGSTSLCEFCTYLTIITVLFPLIYGSYSAYAIYKSIENA